jgi:ABC-type uncharacterized transport system ATPase component
MIVRPTVTESAMYNLVAEDMPPTGGIVLIETNPLDSMSEEKAGVLEGFPASCWLST